jgi:hypothetical protein
MRSPLPLFRSLTSPSAGRKARPGRKGHRRLVVETLEDRTVPAVSLIGAPDWVEQGPGPVSNAGSSVPATFEGATNGIGADPFNANLMFIATVNGGIWQTSNATAAVPNWVHTTDQLPSLSTGAIAISPLDSTGAARTAATPLSQTVVFAGHLRNSSLGGDGGPLSGFLKSTDGGTTWVEVGQLANQQIFRIIPTTMTTGTGQVVLAATGGGLFRSPDGGASWTNISGSNGLPAGGPSDLVADPGTPNAFYAAVAGQGVFRSTNGGQNWAPANGDIPNVNPYPVPAANLITGSSYIQLAVHNTAGNNVVYVAIVPGAPPPTVPPAPPTPQALPQVFRSTNQGANWVAMDNFPETFIGQNSVGDLVADPVNPNVIFMAGLQGVVAGDVFRADFGAAAGTQWQGMTGGATGGTDPHPDIRALAFDQAGDLLCSNDGGIYKLVNPNAGPGPARQWHSLNSNQRSIEFHSVAYDSLNNAIFGGTQDNGTPRQRDGSPPDPLYPFDWPEARGSDGGIVASDNDQAAHPGTTTEYTSTQYLSLRRRVIDNTNTQVSSTAAGVAVSGVVGGVVTATGRNLGGPGTLPTPRPGGYPGGALVYDATIQFVNPFVLNAVAPTRLLIGTSFLYESLDQGDNLMSLGGLIDLRNNGVDDDQDGTADPDADEWQPNGSFGAISAMAYGGRLGGVDNPDVIYVGSGNTTAGGQLAAGRLFLRTVNATNTLADFTTLTNYPGGTPRDIVLDPDNWQRGYVIDSGGNVFRFVNAGAAAADWLNITGGPTNSARLGALVTDLRTIELYTPTTAAGDDVILVGGLGGVFRTLNPQDGANAVWTEFGAGIPNALTKEVHYDATDDLLLAGTFGRGAWTIPNAGAKLLTPGGVLQIDGDTDFAGEDDVIRLLRNANNPSILDVYLNSAVPTFSAQMSVLQQINVNGLGGNDTLIVDSTNGLISVPLGIRYDGGTQSDNLQLVQTAGPTHTRSFYNVGPDVGEGSSIIEDQAGGGPITRQTVSFQNLAPVTDLVPAAILTVNATPDANVINYTQGSVATNGKVTIENFEPIQFSNKTALRINALVGNDVVNLNNGAVPPTGLTSITVDAGDGDDAVTTLAGLPTPVTFTGGDGNDSLSAAGATGAANLDGGTGNDVLIGGAGNDVLTGGTGEDTLDGRGGSNSLTGGTDTDTILVSGTAGADTITATHSGGNFNITGGLSAGTNTISSMQLVRVLAGDGTDAITLNLSAAGGLNYTVLGGNPIGTTGGDSLKVSSAAVMTVTAGPENDAGSVDAATATPTNVSFDEIEKLIIDGGGGGVINGTNGDDAITVIARDATTHAGADGIQDFTAAVNAGLEILFLDQPTLAVNALGGSDTITLRTPAPNNAVWDVAVTVDGGPPSAGTPGGSDRLVVETFGPAPETAVYTPTASDAGTLDLTSLTSPVAFTGIEELLYDGEADNDTLTIVGTGGANTFTATPGAAADAGILARDGTLPIGFNNLGSAAVLNVSGNGGADTLVYNGTAANDTFNINSDGGGGVVGLNAQLPVHTAGVATLRAEGFGGDDTFTLVPAISASPYATLYLNGGSQASAAGDQANLRGTAGADGIAVTGQTVALGGVTVASSGVENINLDSAGGTDSLTYTGVAGVTEAISLAGSATPGTGVLGVPGVTNVTFVNTETFWVNGQPADVDTLTVVGTNGVDRLEIDLAAAGTPADPVLMLQNAAGTVTALTLVNYTGFNILNVNALDGTDVVNVFTAATGPSRNLFVDGGGPAGKNKGTDILNVYYTGKRPRIVHSAATQNPDSGLVTLDFDTAFFSVQYESMEDVNILRQ